MRKWDPAGSPTCSQPVRSRKESLQVCISVMLNGIEHLLMCLLAIGVSSLGLLRPFAHCLLRLFVTFLLKLLEFFLYSGYESYQIDDLQILSSIHGCLFTSLMLSFATQNF